MKNKFLFIAALAFSAGANAQSFFPQAATVKAGYPEGKLSSIYSQLSSNQFADGNTGWKPAYQNTPVVYAATVNVKDCYMMIENIMFSVNKGALTCMTKYMKVKNGDVVLMNGVIITHAGKVLRLKNGDSVNMDGHLTRKPLMYANAEVAIL